MRRQLLVRGAKQFALTRVFILGLLLGGFVAPVLAVVPNPDCTIGVDNVSVIVDTSFSSIQQSAMPSTVQKTVTIVAKCSSMAALPTGTYRWVLAIRDLQARVIQGSTNSSVIDALGKSFSLTKLTLETNNGPPGYAPQYTDSADATLIVSKLNPKVGVGQYLFIQHIDVQRQICTSKGSTLTCSNDGGQKTFAANFTLNVVDKLPPAPTRSRIKPSPWTEPGSWKLRCDC
ncbi:hypothetical protein WJ96_07665 [Burkholderia ubonensis]|uniref:Fimbrial protein n=1 Tax=Burkholderia ubonensis TaxID=101571 RepID=A0AAW3MS14_9BURK|nr:hypothetical protein [Burkholderia ubonensis]KVP75577.1 hypothetical protein WJ93_09465 [Burkholderia ubonensis]KVP98389.1 hypothetical protein WJ96_07665 [Burkholderia ubonensis]KVZ93088.1 hypothetical protein WL25_19330 [Burkholderia ubonensis]